MTTQEFKELKLRDVIEMTMNGVTKIGVVVQEYNSNTYSILYHAQVDSEGWRLYDTYADCIKKLDIKAENLGYFKLESIIKSLNK